MSTVPQSSANTDSFENVESSSNVDVDSAEEDYKFKIDYRQLGEELLERIEQDELYWKRNDAKIRAVKQSNCYEDFRQIVLAAHLTPLKQQEKDAMFHQNQATDRVLWNSVALGKTGCGDAEKSLDDSTNT